MPLSDDEQRILHEIEKEFYDSDPEFARSWGNQPVSPCLEEHQVGCDHRGRWTCWDRCSVAGALRFGIYRFLDNVCVCHRD